MSSVAEPSVAIPHRSRRLRVLVCVLLLLLLIAAGLAAYAYFVARSALPQLDRTIQVKGLSAAVKVTRDGHGVPTIEASTLEDLFFAQGYVTAQDRLWQMDIMRRYGAGELSEILGEGAVKIDREQRILGLRAAARKNLQTAGERDRTYFESYARGVNMYIASHQDKLPIEFRILKYSPQPWKAEDSIVIANQMVKDLNFYTLYDTLARERITAKLGPELSADLYVNRSWHDRPPTVMKEDINEQDNQTDSDDEDEDDDEPDNSVTWAPFSGFKVSEVSKFRSDILSILGSGHGDAEAVNGSNNWVISGAHTITGKPLLSNDMHLGHQMPNLWYEAHLKSGNFDVAGVALPGMPYVIVGHNARIAWGFTNLGPTVTDAFIENCTADACQTPRGMQLVEHRAEMIHVKNAPDVNVDVRITRHGPIVSEIIPGETRQIALRWTLYDGLRMPFFDVDSAQNWEEFRKAFSQLDAPGQNVVYADVDGNIGYQATGRIPIRAAGDGSLPVSGADDAHEWTSYIPFDKLPSIYNPPSGVIATANGRATPDKYPYSISAEWEAPWRTERIYHILESGRKFGPGDMLALQNDIHSENDLFAAERFVYAIDHTAKPSARAKQAADLMRNWDGRMTAASAAPTIAVRSAEELTRLLLEPKLGTAAHDEEDPKEYLASLSWRTYLWEMHTVWLQNVILHQPKRWLPANYANYDELLTAAVEAAVNAPDAPKDLASWRWGRFNALEIEHPVLEKIPVLGRWAAPGVKEQSGSKYCVKAVTPTHGPSERFTANPAELDQSTLNTVTGQGGNFLSPYYMDQWQAWYEGSTFQLPFTSQAVEASGVHRLVLEPAR
jgi:penicillin G amidase